CGLTVAVRKMRIADLSGFTNGKAAMLETEFIVASAKANGDRLVKFVHGEGKIGVLVRRLLRKYKKADRVTFLVFGEKFTEEDIASRYMRNRFPETEQDPDYLQDNKGITIAGIPTKD
ncbi:MAG: hypothetical protein MJ078_06565, partial [Clostridia bacterium]|nr:hypothetical protein [Clostridia bacterium]